MILALGAVLTCLSLAALMGVYWPWIEKSAGREKPLPRDLKKMQALLYERAMVLENLKDLEQDLSFEKISEEDYQSLRQDLLRQAVEIYSKIEALENDSSFFQQVYQDIKA